MDKLSVFEAKARFSEVVSRAEEGKQTVITKRGKAVARVVPEKAARPERWDRSGAIRPDRRVQQDLPYPAQRRPSEADRGRQAVVPLPPAEPGDGQTAMTVTICSRPAKSAGFLV